MKTTTIVCFGLMAMVALSAAFLAGCEPETLSRAEQFDAVINTYPAVAEYIIESDAVLDVFDRVDLFDFIESDSAIVNDPIIAQRLRESLRLSKCLQSGLDTWCYEATCTSSADTDCDFDCEIEQGARQIACLFREQRCRASATVTCRFTPETP